MSSSLYQKYRPQRFSDLVGQDHIRATLLSELRRHTPSHAYLFAGPRGIGKTTTARLLARAVNCETPVEGESCNSCGRCRLIMEGKSFDIVEIDAASHTGVDHVREHIIENARVAPSILPWKVFIIDEVHMLSTSAFNALLKTLEEPPHHTMFILATTEIHKVPATILSRCEQFHFRRISAEAMKARLVDLVRQEGKEVDDAVLTLIAHRADGAQRDAESLLGQVLALDDHRITSAMTEIILPPSYVGEIILLWEYIVQGKAAAALAQVSQLCDEGVHLVEFLDQTVALFRQLLLARVAGAEHLATLALDEEMRTRLENALTVCTPEDLLRHLEGMLEAAERMKNTPIPQLPLEMAIVQLADASREVDAPRDASVEIPAVSEAPKAPAQALTLSTSIDTPTDPTSLTVIQEHWSSVLDAMKRENHALHLTFTVGHLVAFDTTTATLKIGFQHKFYQDRLHDHRNRSVIDSVFEHIFGKVILIDAVIGPEYTPQSHRKSDEQINENNSDDIANVWELAAAAFGSNIPPADSAP